jgi:NADH:ubiquinone oxidoreductase subunit F (NADH-binding)
LCKSYVKKALTEVGSSAAGREDKKVEKYSNLLDNYHFVPVGIETCGTCSPQGIKQVKQIGKKIQDATGEKLSTLYLFQSISIAIQKGNAVCMMGCPKDIFSGLEGLFNFQVHEAEEL